MNARIIEMGYRKAQQSHCNYKVAAIGLDNKGQVVATARNHTRFDKYAGGKHAEMNVLEKGGARIRSIFICRVTGGGKLRSMDCCPRCKKVLDRLGVKVYSIPED